MVSIQGLPPSLAFFRAFTFCSHVVRRLENAVFSSNIFWQRVAFTGASCRPVAVQHQQLCKCKWSVRRGTE